MNFFQKVLNATVLSPHGNYIDGHVDVPRGRILKQAVNGGSKKVAASEKA